MINYWREFSINTSHIDYLSYATITVILSLQTTPEFGLVINIGRMGII